MNGDDFQDLIKQTAEATDQAGPKRKKKKKLTSCTYVSDDGNCAVADINKLLACKDDELAMSIFLAGLHDDMGIKPDDPKPERKKKLTLEWDPSK